MEFSKFLKVLRKKKFSIVAMNEYKIEHIYYLFCVIKSDNGDLAYKDEGLHHKVFDRLTRRLGY